MEANEGNVPTPFIQKLNGHIAKVREIAVQEESVRKSCKVPPMYQANLSDMPIVPQDLLPHLQMVFGLLLCRMLRFPMKLN